MAYFITGAGHLNGLGGALALHLLECGKNVVINGRNIDDKWYEYKMAYADRLHIVVGDITDPEIQELFINEAYTLGGMDALINNASSIESDPRNRDDWQNDYLINVIVPYELSWKARLHLSKTKGCIVNIGSRAGLQVTNEGGNVPYSIAKAALHHLTITLASQFHFDPVRVNAIAPGMFESDRLKIKFAGDYSDNEQRFFKKSIIKDRITHEELVKSVMFLIENKNITGQILPICNGASINRA
jgi:NAD(P)-dependent dehydrogenase (short-subunit alcohol dehydrogenase family)